MESQLKLESERKEILTVKDVMSLLDISRTSVYRRMSKGVLVGYKMSGRLYFKRSEIILAIEAGKQESEDIKTIADAA